MDNTAWGEELEAGKTAHELFDDVQIQRSPLGAIGASSGLHKLEVSTVHICTLLLLLMHVLAIR